MSAQITRILDIDRNARIAENDGLVIRDGGRDHVVSVEDYLQGETRFDRELSPAQRLSKINDASGRLRLAPSLFERLNEGSGCPQVGESSHPWGPCDLLGLLHLLRDLLWLRPCPWDLPLDVFPPAPSRPVPMPMPIPPCQEAEPGELCHPVLI